MQKNKENKKNKKNKKNKIFIVMKMKNKIKIFYYVVMLYTIAFSGVVYCSTPQKVRDIFSTEVKKSIIKPSEMYFVHLHYISVLDIMKQIKGSQYFSATTHVSLIPDQRSNSLVIIANPVYIARFVKWLHFVDVPLKQILIKILVLHIDQDKLRYLGVHFESGGEVDGKGDYPTIKMDRIRYPLIQWGAGYSLDGVIQALQKRGYAKVQASPELLTRNHQQASIESGQEIPYQQENKEGGTNIAFKKAVLKLIVTPHILPHNQLLLSIVVNQDKVSSLTVAGVPAIQTQHLITEARLRNRETVVLGGIYEDNDAHQTRSIPLLSHIPILGFLFRFKQSVHLRRELVIFVTPKILG